MIKLLKKYGSLLALTVSYNVTASTSNLGIIGGVDGLDFPISYSVSASGDLATINLSGVSQGGVYGSAINASGSGILGGRNVNLNAPFAYLVPASGGTIQSIQPLVSNGIINSVAINDFGIGLIGGEDTTASLPLAYLVSSLGVPTKLSLSSTPNGYIESVAINDSGTGLLGGHDGSFIPLVYSISSGVPTQLIVPIVSSGTIFSVAIDELGYGIIGGADTSAFTVQPIAYLVSPSGDLTNLAPDAVSGGIIYSVAINNSGSGIIGGEQGLSVTPLVSFVQPSGVLTAIDLSSVTNGYINSVAINDFGYGILGGVDSSTGADPLAYLISPSGDLTKLDLSLETNGSILTVDINSVGAGIIGGSAAGNSISYLVSPTGGLTKLDLSLVVGGQINTVSIRGLMSTLTQIPTVGLSGNNLVFANYINENANYDAFYFVPAVLDGTLNSALESAAPTRNALNIYTADNNLFFLNQSFSRHSRNSRQLRNRIEVVKSQSVACQQGFNEKESDGLLAIADGVSAITDGVAAIFAFIPNSTTDADNENTDNKTTEVQKASPYALWGEVIGAVSYQKAQDQTPGFEPVSGGLILGFDAKATEHSRFGVGAAYAYTHIHEKESAGHSNINQEYLFIYGLWSNYRFYVDSALWSGLFQGDNVRDIHMTGFNFQSKGHLKGWQLAPHLEVGYNYDFLKQLLLLEPFVMVDWINNWQNHYKETGNGPFNVGQKSQYSSFLRSEVGLRLYETISFNRWRLVVQEKLSYVNKKPFEIGSVSAFILGAPGSFTLETFTAVQNLGAAELQFIFEPVDPRYPYGTIAYQGEYGASYQSHQVSINVSWDF